MYIYYIIFPIHCPSIILLLSHDQNTHPMNKFKIQITLRSAPQKINLDAEKPTRILRRDTWMQDLMNGRSASLTLPDPRTNSQEPTHATNQRQCLLRPPSSQKQKLQKKFTEKCLEILSKKKEIGSNQQHYSKMRTMMHNVVEKYRKVINQSKPESNKKKANSQRTVTQPLTQPGYSQLTGFEDKVEMYRLIKSTDLAKQNVKEVRQIEKTMRQEVQWKLKPDITGIRTNNLLRFTSHDIKGVQCFSLPLSEFAFVKRQSMILQRNLSFNPQPERAVSTSSSRRKISINKANANKFMAFSINSDSDGLYMKKLKSFLDFIFKINYSNKIYISLQLSDDTYNIKKYKVFIGKGNNSLLIKSLLKRRFWLEIVDNEDDEDISFYWSQNKINKLHYKQPISKNLKLKKISQQKKGPKKKEPKDPEQKQMIELNKKILPIEQVANVEQFICKDGFYIPQEQRYICNLVTNHLPRNSCIGSKKNLFKSLYYYYRDYLKTNPFDYIPLTYNVKGSDDIQFKKFLKEQENHPSKIWIVKPGQNSNRGTGIKLAYTTKIIELVRKKQKHSNGQAKTYIIQSYIDKPFLYNNRKFDIRHYMLLTSVNGIIKAYWYKQGYLRTSSEKYDIEDLSNEQMHLTNDAIQKKYDQYQKYEAGNKLSYAEFQRYLDMTYSNKGYNFERDIVAKMKSIILDVIKANYNVIDRSRRECNFQIFGFDFMIDRDFKPWLIQINFNPCLEINCPVLSRIIPSMVQNSLRIGLDPLLPPCNHYPGSKRFSLTDNFLKNLKYQLVFDELTFNETIPIMHEIEDSDDEEEEYADEGKEIQQLII